MRLSRISQDGPDIAAPATIKRARFYTAFLSNLQDSKIKWRARDKEWRRNPMWTTKTVLGFFDNASIFVWRMDVNIDSDTAGSMAAALNLFMNVKRDPVGEDSEHVATWVVDKNELGNIDANILREYLDSFGMNNIQLPFETKPIGNLEMIPDDVRLTRIRSKLGPACAIKIWVKKEGVPKKYVIKYQLVNLETGKVSEQKNLATQGSHGAPLTPYEVAEVFNSRVQQVKANGFVDKDHPLYIPVQANSENFDFLLNRWKGTPPVEMITKEEPAEEEFIEEGEPFNIDFGKILSSKQGHKVAQNFSGFYTGAVPDYAVEMLGTPAVDASQIKSMFNRVDDAINLVNRFDSSLLTNISFIFNFSHAAYGVYIPALDRAIKMKAVKKKLENMGYLVDLNEKGVLTAYTGQQPRSSEEIQADINTIYQDLESKGGTALGVNMMKVLDSARQDAMSSQSPDPNVWEWMAVLHLGGTIVHEAIHAKGAQDEGPSQSMESKFTQWALPIINEEYRKSLASGGQEEMFAPISIGSTMRHAIANWYKKAQKISKWYTVGVAKDPNTDPEILAKILSRGNDDWTSWNAARNPNCPPQTLVEVLSRGKDDNVSQSAAHNPNCPPQTLVEVLSRGNDDDVSRCAAYNHNCPPQALVEVLGRGKDDIVSRLTAENPNCPPQALAEVLGRGKDDVVSRRASLNPNCPSQALAQVLSRGNNDDVSQYASHNPNCPPQALIKWMMATGQIKKDDPSYIMEEVPEERDEDLEKLRSLISSSQNWYKKAQSLAYYAPEAFLDTPIGSDISGRFGGGTLTDKGYGPWGMMAQEYQSAPIETKLGRQFMSPLPRDLDQENDSIEEQLRKYTREDQKINPGATITEMLSEGYDPNRGYKTTEELLDEKRPKPLVIPIDKSASGKTSVLKKKATLFGWMNNLEISDGNTIPGLGDRVMSWDSRDEDFSEDEEWIRKQPRYNPTYDIKGFYYRYIEPRFRPELFDSMTSDYSGVHPAKRFASKMEFDSDFVKILAILSKIKRRVSGSEIKSTRLVMTEDILPLVDKIFKKTDLAVKIFPLGKQDDGDNVFSVWIASNTIDEEKIIKAEEFFAGNTDVNDDVLEELLGPGAQREKTIQGIMESLSKIYENYTFSYSLPDKNNLRFLAGGILVMNFGGINRDHYFKIGGLLADKLDASELKINSKAQTIYFISRGLPIILTNKK